MRKIYIYIILFLSFLYADNIEAYGTLGDVKIHIYIDKYENSCRARYYYDSELLDIESRECNVDNDKYNIYIRHGLNYKTNKADNEEHFILSVKNNVMNGTWQKNSMKPKVVNLKISKGSYEKFRNDNLDFSRDKIESVSHDREIVWIEEKHSGVLYPRLGNGFDKQHVISVNNVLEDIQKNMAKTYLTCVSSFNYGSGLETNSKLEFVGKDFVSISSFDSYYCGGAHPDFTTYGILIEIKSGKVYDIDEILAFDVTPPKYTYNSDSEAFMMYAKYKGEHFAPNIKKMVFESQGWDLNEEIDPDDLDNCDYGDNDIWRFVSWYATKDGLSIVPSFARAMRCCEDNFVIPYSMLSEYKNPNFPYRLEDIAK